MNILLVLLALGFGGTPTPTLAAQIVPVEYSSSTASIIIEAYAVHYGISYQPLLKTLQCESHLNASAKGDGGNSYGVAQIHLPSHPYISKEEALDPFFAIDWTAQQFKAGKQKMWTCYRNLYGQNDT